MSVRTDLKYIDSEEPHQIQNLPRVLGHVIDLHKNTEGATRLSLMTASTSLHDSPQHYKPKYINHQGHPILQKCFAKGQFLWIVIFNRTYISYFKHVACI